MTDRPFLHRLAERLGIEAHYHGYDGHERATRDDTREALLAALGFDASDERRAQEALHALAYEDARPGTDPVRVLPFSSHELARLTVRVPTSSSAELAWRMELSAERGEPEVSSGVGHHEGGALQLSVHGGRSLAPGYYALRCEVGLRDAVLTCEQSLIVVPETCVTPDDVLGERSALGVWAHLYALRSAHDAGIGDLGDLKRLCTWAAGLGADFIGINPLHDTDDLAREVSPYFPHSRLYANPIYLELGPALARAGGPDLLARLGDSVHRSTSAELSARARTDYAAALAVKRPLLEAAHHAFVAAHRGKDTNEGRAYAAYLSEQGDALRSFALCSALRERLGTEVARWPLQYRNARSTEVARFATEHAEAIDFHAYLQHELALQLAECQDAARTAGMRIGLYGDLAVGDAPSSAELWARPELFARGVSVGAPPDAYSDEGQSWGLLPLHPRALRRDGYRHFRAIMRQALRHAGALRIDHVMGLMRQFWVPSGGSARDGAYVRYPLADLLGIVALESRRANALIVGEDLGLVPAGFRERMAQHGLLRSQVLCFERDERGELLAPEGYARGALLTAGTHDLPPLLGYVAARDLTLRRSAGAFASDEAAAAAFDERARFGRELVDLLRRLDLLPHEADEPAPAALVRAVCSLLARSSARLVAVALDDLTLELEPLNTPGVSLQATPNWSRRSSLTLEQLMADPRVQLLLRDLCAERARG